jgi:hypothetical protein
MSWTFLGESKPVARRNYRCFICDTRILKGEKHVARRGVGDDGPTTKRFHLECEKLSSSWSQDDWECHWPGDVDRPLSPVEEGEA